MEQIDYQNRIAELERQVYHLSNRVTALEAVQPHMATKAEMIASRGIFNFHFGRRKRKTADNTYWINNDRNFAIALIAVSILTLILTPTVIDLLATLFARIF
ncbi:MAG: hypothetical protein OXI30_05140 [Chloroflexota bacterium]|nr:hypothetical protein [Chloroflexota bacterium]